MAPEGMTDEDKEAWVAEMNEKDPAVERFRALQEHGAMPGLEFSWVKKIVGDTQ